jgi:hypothetical protein
MSRNNNWADVLDQNLDYLVIRKANRLQVVVRPTTKQARRRGKRHWSLVEAIPASGPDGAISLPDQLRDAIMQNLQEMASGHELGKKDKQKKGKGKKVEAGV